jgi:hypothetical protein
MKTNRAIGTKSDVYAVKTRNSTSGWLLDFFNDSGYSVANHIRRLLFTGKLKSGELVVVCLVVLSLHLPVENEKKTDKLRIDGASQQV